MLKLKEMAYLDAEPGELLRTATGEVSQWNLGSLGARGRCFPALSRLQVAASSGARLSLSVF